MKLYNSVGPNPRVVRMFLAEKGVELPLEEIDIRKAVNRQAEFLSKNPAGQAPCLELDDGSYISEITAICEYIEELHPTPVLIGKTAEERAVTRMWTRRVDLNICEPLANGFRFGEGLKMFEGRMRCLPEASPGLKAIAQDKITWLDNLIAGQKFISGDKLCLADILLFCFMDFGTNVGQPINAQNANVASWFERMQGRPSASA